MRDGVIMYEIKRWPDMFMMKKVKDKVCCNVDLIHQVIQGGRVLSSVCRHSRNFMIDSIHEFKRTPLIQKTSYILGTQDAD